MNKKCYECKKVSKCTGIDACTGFKSVYRTNLVRTIIDLAVRLSTILFMLFVMVTPSFSADGSHVNITPAGGNIVVPAEATVFDVVCMVSMPVSSNGRNFVVIYKFYSRERVVADGKIHYPGNIEVAEIVGNSLMLKGTTTGSYVPTKDCFCFSPQGIVAKLLEGEKGAATTGDKKDSGQTEGGSVPK